MKPSLANTNPSQINTQPTQPIMISPTPIEPPSAWMRYGTSPTEIILAIAVVLVAVSGVIGAIAFLLQVLVPVMQTRTFQKEE